MHETEADTRANRIDPVLRDAGWSVVDGAQVHRELICPGRILANAWRVVSARPRHLRSANCQLRVIHPIVFDGRKHSRLHRSSAGRV
jgi:hypothetical protein